MVLVEVPGQRIHLVPDVQPGPEGRGSCAPRRSLPVLDGVGAREACCFAETERNNGAQDVAALRARLTSLEDWVC